MADTIIYYRRFSNSPERAFGIWLDTTYNQLEGNNLLFQPYCHALHYGGGVFEGIRARLRNDPNLPPELAVINLDLNAQRFFNSMRSVNLVRNTETNPLPKELESILKKYDSGKDVFIPDDFTPETLKRLAFELIQKNVAAGHIQKERLDDIYIRPLAYRSSTAEGRLGVYSLQHDIDFLLMVQLWGEYLPQDTNLVVYPEGIQEPLRRIKSSANYGLGSKIKNWAAAYSTENGTFHFDDALITDSQRFIQEATGANFFGMYRDGKIITPPTNSSTYILPGITRATVIEIAENIGLNVSQMPIPLSAINGMAAAFLTGTATGICPINKVYDPVSGTVYSLETNLNHLKELRREFNNLIKGLVVAAANKHLQKRVRSAIVPLEG